MTNLLPVSTGPDDYPVIGEARTSEEAVAVANRWFAEHGTGIEAIRAERGYGRSADDGPMWVIVEGREVE